MSKILKILILVLFAGGIAGVGFLYAQPPIEKIPIPEAELDASMFGPPLEKFSKVDTSGNKIFDDLEERIAPAPTEERFDVIVVLNRPIDILAELKEVVGAFEEKFTYPSINGFAANLTKGQVIALAQRGEVRHIEYDAPVFPHLDASQQWFGTTKARADFAVDGNLDGQATFSKDDAVIAVLDTGIDPDHIDITSDKIIGWKDIMNNEPSPYDETNECGGHGTHVSSIAAGLGAANADFTGVSPGAALVGIKVLAEFRTSPPQPQDVCSASESQVVAGVQWMIDQKDTYGINIGNMSLGLAGCSEGTDALSDVVNAAVDAGIAMFVSAGNEGPGTCTIGSPAAAENAVTVGAIADVDPGAATAGLPAKGFYQAYFSSRGPTADERIKPDISSPGVFIMAAEAGTASSYVEMSGTSMSSPFTAGLAGLMLQADPTLTPAEIKNKITTTAIDWDAPGSDIDYGAGRLDGYEAIKSAGGFSGTNIATPAHQYFTGNLTGTGDANWYDINITDTSYPIAVTFITPDWVGIYQWPWGLVGASPDFNIYLYASDGTTLLASSEGFSRQETIGYQPTLTGIYKLKVFSFSGSGDYFFDQSAGTAPAVSITLTTDGATPFEILALGAVEDTTPAGKNDVQTVSVTTGPANLDVKSTSFSDGVNNWSLGSTNGPNQVKWEFASSTAGNWNTFLAPDTLYNLANNIAQGNTQDLYLKITMPTESSSTNQYSATVTIVATAP